MEHKEDVYQLTQRTKVRRNPSRAVYERQRLQTVLEEAFVCHVGIIDEQGMPRVIPTCYGIDDQYLYVHGKASSYLIVNLCTRPACITVTLIDGIVLARSIFNHSANYKSVVIYAQGELVEDQVQKDKALKLISEHIIPGRWDQVRSPTKAELLDTHVIRFPLEEVSGKIRTGPPSDDKKDLSLDCWAGVVPMFRVFGEPEPCPLLGKNIVCPNQLIGYSRPHADQPKKHLSGLFGNFPIVIVVLFLAFIIAKLMI